MQNKSFPYKYREDAFDTRKHPEIVYSFENLKEFGINSSNEKQTSTVYYLDGDMVAASIYDMPNNYLIVNEKGHQFLQKNNANMQYKEERPIVLEKENQMNISGDIFQNGSPDWRDTSNIRMVKSQFGIFEKDMHNEYCKKYYPLPLTHINRNVLNAVKELNVDVKYFKQFNYTDPYYQFKHCALVPFYAYIKPEVEDKYKSILSSVLRSTSIDILFDKNAGDLFRSNIENLDIYINTPHVSVLLGAGYTDGTLPSDGSLSTEFVKLEFEDFYLICLCHFWYNC